MSFKYKIGDKVSVNGVDGVIFSVGYAKKDSRDFTICDASRAVLEELRGYQVNLGRHIRIVKESDIIAR